MLIDLIFKVLCFGGRKHGFHPQPTLMCKEMGLYPVATQRQTHHTAVYLPLEETVLVWLHAFLGPRCRVSSKKARWPAGTCHASRSCCTPPWAASPAVLPPDHGTKQVNKGSAAIAAPHRKTMNKSHLIFTTTSIKSPLRQKQRNKMCKDFTHISQGIEGRPPVQEQDPFQLGLEFR